MTPRILVTTAHVVHECSYHIVWTTKYRRRSLTTDRANQIVASLRRTAEALGCQIEAMEVMPDHVHILINAPPQLAPSHLAGRLKGASARAVGAQWTRSSFIATTGGAQLETIKRYIENQ